MDGRKERFVRRCRLKKLYKRRAVNKNLNKKSVKSAEKEESGDKVKGVEGRRQRASPSRRVEGGRKYFKFGYRRQFIPFSD